MSSLDHCDKINSVVGSHNLCTGKVEYYAYGYNVSKGVAGLFVVLFGLSSLVHLIQALRSRMYYLLWTILFCTLGETIGWSGRLWSAISAQWLPNMGGVWYSNRTAFMMQIASLIICPAFLSAMWYVLLGRLIQAVGPQYSKINPKTYMIIFVAGDVLSLVIQAVGGASAAGAKTDADANIGGYVMVAGVDIQMFIMLVYTYVFGDFVWRYTHDRPARRQIGFKRFIAQSAGHEVVLSDQDVKRVKWLMRALILSTTAVFVRSIFRTAELVNGWNGPIITNQALFTLFDAWAIFIGVVVFNFIHPGRFFPKGSPVESVRMGSKSAFQDSQISLGS